MLNYPPYSVLMTVYYRENPADFRAASISMLEQTFPPEEFVLVCDGALTPELDAVIGELDRLYPEVFTVVRNPQNRGIGFAANLGLAACRNEIVVKMDADDIACPTRCEEQIKAFLNQPDLDLLGGYLEEFEGKPENIVSLRKVPLTHEEIMEYAKRRNPFNNQTIAYRRSLAQKCGGYRDMARCEDYEFVTRLLRNGAKAANLPQVLTLYRLNENAYKRRNDWKNTKAFIQVRRELWKSGFSSFLDFLIPTAAQLVLFVLPSGVTRWFYEKILRKG